MANEREFWFPAKRYGWGWGPPVKWQGWAVLLLFVAAVLVVAVRFPPNRDPLAFAGLIFVALLTLMAICWLKGEPPRWRWGEKDKAR
jgi:uncharacterized membrane protein YhaH (DUF805 family)